MTDGAPLIRIIAGFVMGSITLAMIGLTAVLGRDGPAAVVNSLALLLIVPIAAITIVLIATLSSSARTVWGRLCLMNGGVSITLAGAAVQAGQPLWPADPVYERALDEAIKWWLRHMIWTGVAYAGAMIIVGAVLFALSYRLLHPPSGRRRDAL